MKTKDLIRALQEIDPGGEMLCVVLNDEFSTYYPANPEIQTAWRGKTLMGADGWNTDNYVDKNAKGVQVILL